MTVLFPAPNPTFSSSKVRERLNPLFVAGKPQDVVGIWNSMSPPFGADFETRMGHSKEEFCRCEGAAHGISMQASGRLGLALGLALGWV